MTGLNFQVNPGDFLVVVGENGVGKTTMVRSLLGQLKPRQGQIKLASDIKIGYVPQFRNLDSEYPLSARDFVALNLPTNRMPWLNRTERQRVKQIVAATDLTRIADRPLGMASGGEKQRAYLAQALLADPQLLILDESTASLDNEMKYDLLDLVEDFRAKGGAVLFVTHDWALARHYGTRYLHLEAGQATSGPISELPTGEEEE
ncbi:ATP-binding cassette domain-containing protein [Limosilactobacillus fermentum]